MVSSSRDNVAHAASRIRGVARETGDEVHGHVEYGLPGSGSAIDADVIAIGSVMFFDDRFGCINRAEKRNPFVTASIKPTANMSSTYQECVPGRNWKTVPQPNHEFISMENTLVGGSQKRQCNLVGLVMRVGFHYSMVLPRASRRCCIH